MFEESRHLAKFEVGGRNQRVVWFWVAFFLCGDGVVFYSMSFLGI